MALSSAILSFIFHILSAWMSTSLLLSPQLFFTSIFYFFPSHLPFPPPSSTHPGGRLLLSCLIEGGGGMALTSAEQKQQSYLRGFLASSELLIHHVSSLFCSEMQKETRDYFIDHSQYRTDRIPIVVTPHMIYG